MITTNVLDILAVTIPQNVNANAPDGEGFRELLEESIQAGGAVESPVNSQQDELPEEYVLVAVDVQPKQQDEPVHATDSEEVLLSAMGERAEMSDGQQVAEQAELRQAEVAGVPAETEAADQAEQEKGQDYRVLTSEEEAAAESDGFAEYIRKSKGGLIIQGESGQNQERFNQMVARANEQLTPRQTQAVQTEPGNPAAVEHLPTTEQTDPQESHQPEMFDFSATARQTGRQEISTPQPAQAATPAPQAEQVSQAVSESLAEGRSEFELELNPLGLGRVNVRLVMEAGRLAVHIMAANAAAANALREQTDGLIFSLRMSGVEVEGVQVVEGTSESSGQMYDGKSQLEAGRDDTHSRSGGEGSQLDGQAEGEGYESQAETGESTIEPERILNRTI